ncbi:MAG: sulfatase [Chthoniobacter sp.]|nr:sulfatase [Chthoniobacter sp.]
MNLRLSIFTVVAAALLAAIVPARAAEATKVTRPNIVFILADDLGWSDTTLYGTTKFYETPNIARLAARGIKLTNAYAACPVCSPTRASIMAGLYPGRLGITTPSGHVPEEMLEASLIARGSPSQKSLMVKSATRLKLEYFTIAEALKEAGYATGHFGKWHLGPEPFDPLHQGFDVDIPHWSGPGPSSYLAPWRSPKFNLPAKPGEQLEDLMSQEAIKFIHTHKDEPFFLNYWAFSVHSPWGAKPGLIEKYRAKADPNSAQRNPVYGGMVQSLDEAVGRLLDTLDELKLSDHTIIVFFSDNGGVNWWEPDMKTQAGMDSAPTSNAPLRAGKGTLYEGGTREPCVFVWPGKTKPAAQSDALFNSVDFYPTLLEMAGLQPKAGIQLDGVSQVPALLGTGTPRDTAFCYYPVYSPPGHVVHTMPGVWARRGDWKLIRFFHDADDQSDRFELYNLRDDLGETKDLAAQFPDRVKELNALIDVHLADTRAIIPGKNPAYNALVPDWAVNKETAVTVRDGALAITAGSSPPSLSTRDLPHAHGPYTVEFRMKSNGKGNGRIFWAANPREPFFRDRTATFTPQHDNEWHDFTIPLPVETPIEMLRFDAGAGPGEVHVAYLRLKDRDGAVIKEWNFSQTTKP